MMRVATTWVIACLILPPAARAYSVRLDAGRCLPLAGQAAEALGPAWKAFTAYAQRCPVPGPDGRTVLTVDIVRLDRAYAAHLFNGHPDLTLPNPVLRDVSGHAIGMLPEGFPVDPPGKMRVTFADWRDGLPWRIELYEAGEDGASPLRLPSMQWHPETGAYVWPVAPRR